MKYFEWDEEKNKKLKKERDVSFEEIVTAIIDGNVRAKIKHPNAKRYAGQKLYLVDIHDYIFVVPCIEDTNKIELKTIFPSRKYTKKYIEKGEQ